MRLRRRKNLNSLGLCGDFDDVEIVRDAERVFGIHISDSEANEVRTVGQFYDLILTKLPDNSSAPDVCLTAAAFYRLRTALMRIGDFGRLAPHSELDELVGSGSMRRLWRQLEKESGLTLPGPFVDLRAAAVCLIGTLALPLGIILTVMTGVSLFLLLLPVSVLALRSASHVLPMPVPAEFAFLGGLSRGVVHENFRDLADARRTYRAEDVWNTLDYLLRKQTGIEQPIDRDTVFFDEHHP